MLLMIFVNNNGKLKIEQGTYFDSSFLTAGEYFNDTGI